MFNKPCADCEDYDDNNKNSSPNGRGNWAHGDNSPSQQDARCNDQQQRDDHLSVPHANAGGRINQG